MCINLADRPDRWLHMQAEAERENFDIERVLAVDGRDPQVALRAKQVKPMASGRRMSSNAYACFQSHILAWRKLAAGSEHWGLVLEDDVMLAPGFGSFVRNLASLPVDADVVKLETWGTRAHVSRDSQIISKNLELRRLYSSHIGAAAYLISRQAVKTMLKNCEHDRYAVDVMLFGSQGYALNNLNVYQIWPALAVQPKRIRGRLAKHSWELASMTEHFVTSDPSFKPVPVEHRVARAWRIAKESLRSVKLRSKYAVVPYNNV